MTVTAKICGINDPEAMRAAITGRASHVGLVFYSPSPRAVNPGEAMALSAVVPERVQKVGLFVDPEDDQIDKTLSVVKLDMLQLHGDETPDRVRDLKARTGKKVMKVIKVSEPEDLVRAEAYVRIADALMFDAKPPKGMKDALPGGNAVSFDWRILSGRKWPLPWMLAGGLTKYNVETAVELSGARIVDTSSGVEDVPGHKNVDKITEFLRAVAGIR
ncbi:MAG: phosphoribosylanthranilate isomerase [Pseudomonadota bacterium]|nr:phosphoribosylanthranilate isomerase [Pseudomonadota bacterium]MEC7655607.1 phosphoribosylanthranilate isomerase [Pseudomonadota bacterium]|tara:strand:- start:129 stop:779 length:651 start_codon:yes stop_codon:yes gene_type:complete